MKQTYCLIGGIWLCTFSAIAQSETTDSIKTQELNEVVVEAKLQSTSATVSTYLPTSKQKILRRPQPNFSSQAPAKRSERYECRYIASAENGDFIIFCNFAVGNP